MANEIFSAYWLELCGRKYRVRNLKGHEGMSTPFRFVLEFVADEHDPLDPVVAIRTPTTLELVHLDREERHITGIVTDISRNHDHEVRVVLEPTLALLRHRQDIRLFRNKTAPDIAAEVMRGLGVAVEQRLSESYKVRPYTVQFRETDLDFAHRLLEDEGVHYFITEDDVVVFGDSTGAYDPTVGIFRFRHDSGMGTDQHPITEIGARGTMTAGKVTLRDFNPEHPRLNMDVSAAGPTKDGVEYYDYPGEYEEPSEGQRKANVRAEAWRCQHHRVGGISWSARFRPGVVFETYDTPSYAFDGEYVTTRITHDWRLDAKGYSVKFEALPASVVYRPPVVTPAPVQTNPLTGFVTGPPAPTSTRTSGGR